MRERKKAYPSARDCVKIRATNATVADLDVDIVFLERLGLEFFPHHLAVRRFRIQAQPSNELVASLRHDVVVDDAVFSSPFWLSVKFLGSKRLIYRSLEAALSPGHLVFL